ncbi:hypothetical protein H6P81_018392 [Aristolochia fimbriata]|uniref:Uncharacterized protein n=1 Tax=Aristolochia fimbriata TaxID=158543 RepID=A0AAV7E192_ARIFI|nr:hypothetical protein H6P81_018392 [Aristolochia fimbriata]
MNPFLLSRPRKGTAERIRRNREEPGSRTDCSLEICTVFLGDRSHFSWSWISMQHNNILIRLKMGLTWPVRPRQFGAEIRSHK